MAVDEKAKVSITGETAGLTRALASASKSITKFAAGAGKRVSSALGTVGGQLTAIGGLASIGGFAVFANSALDFEEGLTRLAIQADASTAQTEHLRRTLNQTSKDFGISRQAVLGGVDALVNLQGASAATPSNIQLIGKAMSATGADARDLAGTMFALQDNFNLDPGQLEAALSGVTAAGKAASIPLAELAQTLQQQAANLVQLTGQGTEGVAKTVAILQVLRKGFGSAAEAGTGAKAIGNAFKGNAKKLKDYGVEVFKVERGKKVFRDVRDILMQIGESKLAKDPALLTKALGSSEAETAVRVLLQNVGVYDQLVEAGRDYNTLQRDSNKFLSSSVGRQKAAIAKLKTSIESVFTPEAIEGFAIALEAVLKGARALFRTFLDIADSIGPIRDAAEGLANALARATGLQKSLDLKGQAPQLLARQAEAFGRGAIDKNLKDFLVEFEQANAQNLEEKAAAKLARNATSRGLIVDGKVHQAAAQKAFLAAQGATPSSATAAQRDIASTRIAGLERALRVLAENQAKRQQVDVKVDVRVDGDATAQAQVRQARSG